jgi:protein phosphatase
MNTQLLIAAVSFTSAGLAAVFLLFNVFKRHGASSRKRRRRGDRPRTSPEPAEPDDGEITRVTISLDELGDHLSDGSIPEVELDEEAEEPTPDPLARPHTYTADTGADQEMPTLASECFLVSAAAQTSPGKRRSNQDRYLLANDLGVFCVADGMGGYAGGELAAELAVETLSNAFHSDRFHGHVVTDLPRRPMELVQSVQMANLAIYERARAEPHLRGMGTTVVAARFALYKNRLYLAHVGDSRCYRLRERTLRQITEDHTLGALGASGAAASHLTRAVGVGSRLDIDIITAEPRLGDIYLLCSDGLNKHLSEETLRECLEQDEVDRCASDLVERAEAAGASDNITAVVIAVRAPPTRSK